MNATNSSKQVIFKIVIGFLFLTVSWWLPPSLLAATQAKKTIPAMVVVTCNLIVDIANATPSVKSSCTNAAEKSAEGKPVVRANEEAKRVTVAY